MKITICRVFFFSVLISYHNHPHRMEMDLLDKSAFHSLTKYLRKFQRIKGLCWRAVLNVSSHSCLGPCFGPRETQHVMLEAHCCGSPSPYHWNTNGKEVKTRALQCPLKVCTGEAEVGGTLSWGQPGQWWVPGQAELHRETVSKTKNKKSMFQQSKISCQTPPTSSHSFCHSLTKPGTNSLTCRLWGTLKVQIAAVTRQVT